MKAHNKQKSLHTYQLNIKIIQFNYIGEYKKHQTIQQQNKIYNLKIQSANDCFIQINGITLKTNLTDNNLYNNFLFNLIYSSTLKKYYPYRCTIILQQNQNKIYQTHMQTIPLDYYLNYQITDKQKQQIYQINKKIMIIKNLGQIKLKLQLSLKRISPNQQNISQNVLLGNLQKTQIMFNQTIQQPLVQLNKKEQQLYLNKERIKNIKQAVQQQLDYYKQQIQILGQQLIQQRRKNKQIQSQILDLQQRNLQLKRKNKQLQLQLKHYIKYFKVLSDNINNDLHIDSKKQCLTIKYKDQQFVQRFQQFIQIIDDTISKAFRRKSSESISSKSVQKQNNINEENSLSKSVLINSPSNSQCNGDIFNKIGLFIQQKQTIIQQSHRKQQQISLLKIQLQNKNKQIQNLSQRMSQLNQQIIFIEARNKQMFQQLQYYECTDKMLKEKDIKNIQLLKEKDQSIQNYKKLFSNRKQQIQQKNKLSQKLHNSQLLIQQYKQQISNLGQIIQKYKIQYGSLKLTKNRQIQLQIKDYIRQIDLIRQFDQDTYQGTNINQSSQILSNEKSQLNIILTQNIISPLQNQFIDKLNLNLF